MSNGDLLLIRSWYDFLAQNGIQGLANGTFSNYPPAYLYLLWFSTLFAKWISPATAIKLIPTAFDLLSALMIFKIARTKFDRHDKPFLFAVLFLLLPTVMVNSTGWGQIDNTYTSLLLVCFYLILTKRPFGAAGVGAAFSLRRRRIFLLPFLGIMLLRKQVRWYDFLAIPAVYVGVCPARSGARQKLGKYHVSIRRSGGTVRRSGTKRPQPVRLHPQRILSSCAGDWAGGVFHLNAGVGVD